MWIQTRRETRSWLFGLFEPEIHGRRKLLGYLCSGVQHRQLLKVEDVPCVRGTSTRLRQQIDRCYGYGRLTPCGGDRQQRAGPVDHHLVRPPRAVRGYLGRKRGRMELRDGDPPGFVGIFTQQTQNYLVAGLGFRFLTGVDEAASVGGGVAVRRMQLRERGVPVQQGPLLLRDVLARPRSPPLPSVLPADPRHLPQPRP